MNILEMKGIFRDRIFTRLETLIINILKHSHTHEITIETLTMVIYGDNDIYYRRTLDVQLTNIKKKLTDNELGELKRKGKCYYLTLNDNDRIWL